MEFYTAVNPVLKVLKLFGLWAFRVDHSGRYKTLTTSRSGCCMGGLYVVIFVGCIFRVFAQWYTIIKGPQRNNILLVIFKGKELNDFVSSTICVLYFNLCARQVFHVVKVTHSTDFMFQRRRIQRLYERSKEVVKYQLMFLKYFFVLKIVVIAYILYYDLDNVFGAFEVRVRIWALFFIQTSIANCLLLQFLDLALLLMTRWSLVNRELEAAATRRVRVKVVGSLRRMAMVHSVLSDMAARLSILFGVFTINVALSRFINIVNIIQQKLFAGVTSELVTELLYYVFFVLLMNWLPFLLLIFTVRCVAHEANSTAKYVHRLLHRTWDKTTRTQLKRFSLQLLHRRVQFTACGLFPIDETLLYSMVSAVTTYTVILIQFQNNKQP